MKNIVFISVLFLTLTIKAQTNYFKILEKTPINLNSNRVDKVKKETLYKVNPIEIFNYLNTENNDDIVLNLPDGNGNFKQYLIYESSVLEPSFQSNYPFIRSFKGQGITNPTETLRFTITPKLFNAIILNTLSGTQYIRPIEGLPNVYTSFLHKDLILNNDQLRCGVQDDMVRQIDFEDLQELNTLANDGIMREYRIAIAATAEYSELYNNDVNEVIAAMVVAVNSANAILERDLSVRLVMVDNTSIIYFDAATDPYDNNNNAVILGQNQNVLDTNIGFDNYDIGHVFNTAGGGLAGVSVVCTVNKAAGVSFVGIPTFLHEIGHQFGSTHTFNGNEGECLNYRVPSTAVEPGSGSTIMSYAGFCGSQNVVFDSDLYYHGISLNLMKDHIINSGSCPPNQNPTGNSLPTAEAGPDVLIPQGTPYKLTGSSTDPDGTSTHTYTWEQFDLGPPGLPTVNTVNGPLVRSREGTSNPTRFVPRLEDLLLAPGSQDWEKLAEVDRNIFYILYVKDNDIVGGQYKIDVKNVNVTTQSGPFVVTSQNTPIVWTPDEMETITWNVAGTDSNGINESSVNILLSVDGGFNYNTVLAANTPNDGSETIIVPNLDSPTCRIMIESTSNIFFNINEAEFALGDYILGGVPTDLLLTENLVIYPNPSKDHINISFDSNSNENIDVQIFDILGKSLYKQNFLSQELSTNRIKISEFTSGMYLVNVKQGNNTVTKKLIIY